jgi:DNA replication and repair protein RecF
MFYIENVELTQFRCYKSARFTFSPTKNIIYGNNASGKTSLVEGIHCLGIGKTFKNAKDNDLVKKTDTFMSVKAQIVDDRGPQIVLFAYDGQTKQITKNNKPYKRLSEYLGYFNVVVFSPDDLELIKGSPSERRRFLDVSIGQIDHDYLESLIRFKKILKERNEYLKNASEQPANDPFLEVLDTSLIEQSRIIIERRTTFVEELNRAIQPINLQLSAEKERLEVVYTPNCPANQLATRAKERQPL